jgi:hypothetical protein
MSDKTSESGLCRRIRRTLSRGPRLSSRFLNLRILNEDGHYEVGIFILFIALYPLKVPICAQSLSYRILPPKPATIDIPLLYVSAECFRLKT